MRMNLPRGWLLLGIAVNVAIGVAFLGASAWNPAVMPSQLSASDQHSLASVLLRESGSGIGPDVGLVLLVSELTAGCSSAAVVDRVALAVKQGALDAGGGVAVIVRDVAARDALRAARVNLSLDRVPVEAGPELAAAWRTLAMNYRRGALDAMAFRRAGTGLEWFDPRVPMAVPAEPGR